jgi:hypothetical protein
MQIPAFAPRQDVRFGSKADMCAARSDVRFTLNSDRKSDFPEKAMSALPPKADMCGAKRDVRFVPQADIMLEPRNRWSAKFQTDHPRRRPRCRFAISDCGATEARGPPLVRRS